MENNKKINFKINDVFSQKIQEGKDGERIVKINGIVCFIDKYSKKPMKPEVGEIWQFAVKKVFEKYMIISPIEIICSSSGLSVLGQIKTEKSPRKEKIKKTFKFLSKNEQRKAN